MGPGTAADNGKEEKKKMITAPRTYAQWAEVLEIFRTKSDDAAAISAMKAGQLEWQSGVAERFSKRLIAAVNERMNAASDKFQRDMNRARGSEGAIVQAILSLRKEMMLLKDAIDIPALPDGDRAQYISLITQQADNMQRSLEDSAKRDRSGKLSSIVRNHKVNVF